MAFSRCTKSCAVRNSDAFLFDARPSTRDRSRPSSPRSDAATRGSSPLRETTKPTVSPAGLAPREGSVAVNSDVAAGYD